MSNNLFSQLVVKQSEYQSIQGQIGSSKGSTTRTQSYTVAKTQSYVDYVTEYQTVTVKDANGKDVVKIVPVQREVVRERTIYEQKQKLIKENQEYNNLRYAENKAFDTMGEIKKIESEIDFVQRTAANNSFNQKSLSLVA